MDSALYIHRTATISAQGQSTHLDFLPSEAHLYANEPDYKSILNPGKLRRMSRVVKMSNYLTTKLMAGSSDDRVAAIITASGLGCTTETLKFMESIDPSMSTNIPAPAAFINSTHNTPGGFLAKMLSCYGYNTTYSQRDHSFESALRDALTLDVTEDKFILLGTFDELNPTLVNIFEASSFLRNSSKENPMKPDVPLSEGCAFFLLSAKGNQGASIRIGNLVTVRTTYSHQNQYLFSRQLAAMKAAGGSHGLIFSGNNGSAVDKGNYEYLSSGNFQVVDYKRMTGEFATANALGVEFACRLLSGETTLPGVPTSQPDFIIFIQHTFDGLFTSFTISK